MDSSEQCALGIDGQLKDASDIAWFHDPDDDEPLQPDPVQQPETFGPGARRSARTRKPTEKVLASGTRKPTAKAKRSAKLSDIGSGLEDEVRGVDAAMPAHADLNSNEGKGDSGDEDDEDSLRSLRSATQRPSSSEMKLRDEDRAVSTFISFPFSHAEAKLNRLTKLFQKTNKLLISV
jgi:hypothetical protein